MKKRIYQQKTATACNRVAKKLISLALVASIGGAGVGNGGLHFTACAQYYDKMMEWEFSQMEQELRFGESTLKKLDETLTRLYDMRFILTCQRSNLPCRGDDYQFQQEIDSFYDFELRLSVLISDLESKRTLKNFQEKLECHILISKMEPDLSLGEPDLAALSIMQTEIDGMNDVAMLLDDDPFNDPFGFSSSVRSRLSCLQADVNDRLRQISSLEAQSREREREAREHEAMRGAQAGLATNFTDSFYPLGLSSFMPETPGQYEDPLFDFGAFMPGPQGFVLPDKVNKDRGKK